jgi:hypothetical protein
VAVRTLPSSLPLSSPFIGDLDARTSHWLDVLRCHKLSINDSVDLALSRLDSSLVTTMTPAFLLHQGKTRWPGPLSEAPHSAALLWVHACLACVPPSVSALASLPCHLGFTALSSRATVFLSHNARDPSTTALNRFGVIPISLHHRSNSIWGWSVLLPPQQFDLDFHPQSNSDRGVS